MKWNNKKKKKSEDVSCRIYIAHTPGPFHEAVSNTPPIQDVFVQSTPSLFLLSTSPSPVATTIHRSLRRKEGKKNFYKELCDLFFFFLLSEGKIVFIARGSMKALTEHDQLIKRKKTQIDSPIKIFLVWLIGCNFMSAPYLHLGLNEFKI